MHCDLFSHTPHVDLFQDAYRRCICSVNAYCVSKCPGPCSSVCLIANSDIQYNVITDLTTAYIHVSAGGARTVNMLINGQRFISAHVNTVYRVRSYLRSKWCFIDSRRTVFGPTDVERGVCVCVSGVSTEPGADGAVCVSA